MTVIAAIFYEDRVRWLWSVERPIYRACGVDPDNGQSWQSYAVSVARHRR